MRSDDARNASWSHRELWWSRIVTLPERRHIHWTTRQVVARSSVQVAGRSMRGLAAAFGVPERYLRAGRASATAGNLRAPPCGPGAIAQLEEHLLCKQGVTSSSLVSSTRSSLVFEQVRSSSWVLPYWSPGWGVPGGWEEFGRSSSSCLRVPGADAVSIAVSCGRRGCTSRRCSNLFSPGRSLEPPNDIGVGLDRHRARLNSS